MCGCVCVCEWVWVCVWVCVWVWVCGCGCVRVWVCVCGCVWVGVWPLLAVMVLSSRKADVRCIWQCFGSRKHNVAYF